MQSPAAHVGIRPESSEAAENDTKGTEIQQNTRQCKDANVQKLCNYSSALGQAVLRHATGSDATA